jgi:hypothetical protein
MDARRSTIPIIPTKLHSPSIPKDLVRRDALYDRLENGDQQPLILVSAPAGYVSWQHWWGADVRSNFTLGAAEVDNPDFVDDDAYKRTLQFILKIRMAKNYLLGIGPFDALWFDDVQSIERITDGDQGEIRERSTI